jgi:hypothetical protein
MGPTDHLRSPEPKIKHWLAILQDLRPRGPCVVIIPLSGEKLVEMADGPLCRTSFSQLLEDFPAVRSRVGSGVDSRAKVSVVKTRGRDSFKAGEAYRFAVNHLFLDQGGVPSFVEVKRCERPRQQLPIPRLKGYAPGCDAPYRQDRR